MIGKDYGTLMIRNACLLVLFKPKDVDANRETYFSESERKLWSYCLINIQIKNRFSGKRRGVKVANNFYQNV